MNDKSAAAQSARFLTRMTIATAAGVAVMVGGLAYGSIKNDRTHKGQVPGAGWSIVQYYKGDAFVLDHGLTHDDCDDMLPRNQAAKGLTFACELGA